MGKDKKKLPACSPCTTRCEYAPACQIPDEPCPSYNGVYRTPCSGVTYCQVTNVPRNCTRVCDSRYSVDWTISVNQGVPSGVYDNDRCGPLLTAPVPYVLQEMLGNTKSNSLVVCTSAYTGCGQSTTVEAPKLGVDYDNMIVADSGDMFFIGAIPMYFVTAALTDLDNIASVFSFCNPSILLNINVAVQAAEYVGETDLLTKVVCVENMAGTCPVELCTKTFRMKPIEDFENPTPEQVVDPVLVTMVLSDCGKFSAGFVHGKAVDTTSGVVYGTGTKVIEWDMYTMVVGKSDSPCAVSDPSFLVKTFECALFGGIYTHQMSLVNSTIVTLALLTVPGGVAIAPGNLESHQRKTAVKESSLSMVKMWADGVDAFNTFIKDVVNAP